MYILEIYHLLSITGQEVRIVNALYGRTSTDDSSKPCPKNGKDSASGCGDTSLSMTVMRQVKVFDKEQPRH